VTRAAAAEMEVTGTAKRRLRGEGSTLHWLHLQQQVMPVQAHLDAQCAREAAAASSEQLEAVATDSAVHAILQDFVILSPALRGCDAACIFRLTCSRRRACMVTMCTTCQVTCKPRTNVVFRVCHAFITLIASCAVFAAEINFSFF
jgi:hypothetical protein